MAVPTLTILAPTHNRPEVLARVWPTWIVQQGVKEIVIVDDGSTDEYRLVFSALSAACDERGVTLKTLKLQGRRGAPAARNAGLELCTSDEIFTTDDDLLLASDMIAKCREQRPMRDVPVIVGPRVIYLRDGETEVQAEQRSNSDASSYFRPNDLTIVNWVDPGKVLRVPFVSALALWPRTLFERGLRYCEEYGGNGYREETDPQLQAQAHFDAEIYLTPSAKSFHLPPLLAYARASGQRRGGRLWFEYWVHRNNARFLYRNRVSVNRFSNCSMLALWFGLIASRFSLTRVIKYLWKT